MNQFLIDRWYITLPIFLVLTFLYNWSNKQFKTNLRGELASEGNEEFLSVNPQVFSAGISKLDENRWNKWQKLIEPREIRRHYNKSFWIDCVWAVFFIAFLYSLAISPSGSPGFQQVVLAVLIAAYLSDLAENLLYLGYGGQLYQWLPFVILVKLLLYTAGIILAVVCHFVSKASL